MDIEGLIAWIKDSGLKVARLAAIFTGLVFAISFLDDRLGVYAVLRSISTEAYVGLGLTIGTTIWGEITARTRSLKTLTLEGQARNAGLIEQQGRETVKLIRELEDAIDTLNIRLSEIDALTDGIRINGVAIHELDLKLVDLDQRLKQGDRLLYVLNLMRHLIEDVAHLKTLIHSDYKGNENTELVGTDPNHDAGSSGLGSRESDRG
jgi:hypothetical protein